MKKYILIASSLLCLALTNSCSESDLNLESQSLDNVEAPLTEEKIQMLLSGAYFNMGSTGGFGTDAMIAGDLLGDNLFVSNTNPSYLMTANKTYSPLQGDFSFYGLMYNIIVACNTVINSTVPTNDNVERIKAESKILRGYAYFTLVNYYSPAPTSGINQEYGVPLVLGNYDALIQPPRATVAQIYDQIIADLKAGAAAASDTPSSKVILSRTAAKLLLSKVYLTRRAPGDAELALQYSNEVINNSPSTFGAIDAKGLMDSSKPFNATSNPYKYYTYFAGTIDTNSENQPETVWELSMNGDANIVTGVGSNQALPLYYNRAGGKRCLLLNKAFYDTFGPAPTSAQIVSDDVRRGSTTSGLLVSAGVPSTDNPKGYWMSKYPLTSYETATATSQTFYYRNIKILRFSEAKLNRIEALRLLGQTSVALTELNTFATSRQGKTYTGTNLLNDILTERAKEFYGEGQRFLDLKRYNMPIVKGTNCTSNCNVPANDKLFVLPVSQDAINNNPNLKQYPDYINQ
ncbi:MAG: RagB/SusD family nutrient uptake outer membrane protein [Weeksellaceae bacterium]|nr:RagB/SusD family nutrient uptake outer membrane protein [Weeksellaceae bacterium]